MQPRDERQYAVSGHLGNSECCVSPAQAGAACRRRARQPAAGEAGPRLTQEAARRLDALMSPELGAVLQDGGLPVSGFARQLAGERWHELAAELLMTAADEDA